MTTDSEGEDEYGTAEIADTIQRVLTRLEQKNVLVLNWIVVAEVMDDDGEQFMSWHVNNGIKVWHIRGLLEEVLATKLAQNVAERVTDA